MKKSFAMLLCLVFSVGLLVSMQQVTATTYTAGVGVGDYVKYNYATTGSFNTDWRYVTLTVTNIVGTIVTAQNTVQLSNGTSKTLSTETADIASSSGVFFGMPAIIPSGLKSGDSIPALDKPINTTQVDTLGSNSRTVGKLIYNATGISAEFHWDQETGFLVYVRYVSSSGSPSGTYTVVMTFQDTNAWSSSNAPTDMILVLVAGSVIAAVAVVAAVFLLKRGKKPSASEGKKAV